jgi:hypothetical protein
MAGCITTLSIGSEASCHLGQNISQSNFHHMVRTLNFFPINNSKIKTNWGADTKRDDVPNSMQNHTFGATTNRLASSSFYTKMSKEYITLLMIPSDDIDAVNTQQDICP